MSVRQELTATLNLLREDGWCQRRFGFRDGEPHYLLGALSKSMDDSNSALRAVRHEVAPWEIVAWNDAPGRTFAGVEALLQRIIDKN